MRYVSFGGPIFLGVVGAILAFAVSEVNLAGIDLSVVGVILLVAAAIWLILSIVVNRPQQRPAQPQPRPRPAQRPDDPNRTRHY